MARKRRPRGNNQPKAVVDVVTQATNAARRFLNDPNQHRSWLMDPYSATLQLGRPSKPSLLSFDIMRSMAVRSPTLRAIYNLRKSQMAAYTRRPLFHGDRGFRIGLKDPKAEMSKSESAAAKEIESFFLHTGWKQSLDRRDNFNIFMRKLVEDSMTFDNAAVELVYDHAGRLSELWAVDGATIEFVISDMWEPQTPLGQESDEPIQYIQTIQGQVVAEYTPDEMILLIRNPQTNLAYFGYGVSELETIVSEVTTELFVMQWAQSVLSRGSIPDGLLIFKGNGFDEQTIEDFQRAYQQLGTGVQNAGRLQVLSVGPNDAVEMLTTHDKPRDLAFGELLELTRVQICDVYGVDLSELNAWRKSGSKGALIDSDATKTRIEASLDKGFIPMMKFYADSFTSHIVDRIDDRFKFEWVGLSKSEEDAILATQIQRLQWALATPNEVRLERDEEAFNDEWGDVPLNQYAFQAWMFREQQKQQEKMAQQQQQLGFGGGNTPGTPGGSEGHTPPIGGSTPTGGGGAKPPVAPKLNTKPTEKEEADEEDEEEEKRERKKGGPAPISNKKSPVAPAVPGSRPPQQGATPTNFNNTSAASKFKPR